MTDRQKQLLAQQMKAQAQALATLEGGQLNQSIVDTCNALLGAAGSVPMDQIDEMEIQDLQAGYLSLAQMVIRFYQGVAQRGDVQSDEQASKAVLDELKEQQEKITRSKTLLEQNKAELESLRINNAAMQAEIDKYEADLEKQRGIEASLIAMQESCTPEMLQAQKDKNETLLNALNENRATLAKLQEQEKILIGENELVKQDIVNVDTAICDIPEENKKLLAEYEEKKALLGKLQEAETECCEENQQKLQAQIDELVPVVERLESVYGMLAERLTDLEQQSTYYDRENQLLSTNVIEKVQAALGGLEKVVTEHKGLLEQTKNQADTLLANVEKCAQLREDYANWFDVNETPLEAMIKKLEYSAEESEQLRQTLNPASIYQVNRLMEETRVNLVQLDKIKEKCVAAVRRDQKELIRNTRKQR